MIPRTRRLAAVATVCTASLGLAACATNTGTTTGTSGTSGAVAKGGTLNMLGAGDVDYMDPNISYYSVGYMALRLWSRQLFTYPADRGPDHHGGAGPGDGPAHRGQRRISADGKTYTITIRQGAKWNTTPARQVTAQDMVRGVKRTCNPVQPFGGMPDFADLIVGYQSFCDGFAKVGPDARRHRRTTSTDTDVAGVDAPRTTRPSVFTLDPPGDATSSTC